MKISNVKPGTKVWINTNDIDDCKKQYRDKRIVAWVSSQDLLVWTNETYPGFGWALRPTDSVVPNARFGWIVKPNLECTHFVSCPDQKCKSCNGSAPHDEPNQTDGTYVCKVCQVLVNL